MLCLTDGGFTIQDGGAVSSGSLDDDGVVALDGVGSIATTGKITVGAAQPGFLAIQNGAVAMVLPSSVGYPATSSVLWMAPAPSGRTTSIKPDSRSALAIPRP